jgi:hypothetical protein
MRAQERRRAEMLNARTQMKTRARTQTLPPDITKCAFIAAIVSAALMLVIGLSFDHAIGLVLAGLAR